MKPLLDYLNAMPVAAQEAFARRCETTVGYLRQIAYGHRACPAHLAINIERESNRALVCEELRPTGVDWAYIRAERRRKGSRRVAPRRVLSDRRASPEVPDDKSGSPNDSTPQSD